jgi:anti-sigma factor RsiW
MMDCTQYRRSILADPLHPSAEMRAHGATCHECAEYTARLLRFESRLDRALRVGIAEPHDAKAAPSAVILPFQPVRSRTGEPRRLRRRAWAIAASVLAGAVIAGALWLGSPGSSLAADVVGHMAEEPDAWARTDIPVPEPKLNKVLSEAHVQLKPSAGLVSYANSCPFRGRVVPHLVVQTQTGPVTVMVLSHEPVKHSTRFDEQGYRGMIVPVPEHGSLAVLEKGPKADMKAVEQVAAQVLGAIEWTR